MTLWKGFFSLSLMRKYFSGLVDLKAQVTHPDWLKLILFFLLKNGFSLKALASPGSDFTVNQDCLCRSFGKWPIWSSQEQLDLTALHPIQTSPLQIHTLWLSHYRLRNRKKKHFLLKLWFERTIIFLCLLQNSFALEILSSTRPKLNEVKHTPNLMGKSQLLWHWFDW